MFSLAVRNVLMSQLVPYLDEYMGHVIKAFEKLNIDNESVAKINRYFEKRSDAIDKRRSLKEMSPKYGYMIEYQEALKTQKQHWQQHVIFELMRITNARIQSFSSQFLFFQQIKD